jgi:type IV pilus assembly protein PilY1
VLVAGGYFPKEGLDADDPAAARKQSSLFVLDMATGAVIREIQTPASVVSYGLSTPAAFDSDLNRTTDVVMAGDLAGNLWRYDLSSANPAQWKVEQFFATYATAADIGKQPVTVMPVAMEDRASRIASDGRVNRPIWVFGTGKYLGNEDRTTNIPRQYFYGVRDYGNGYSGYPLLPAGLVAQTFLDNGALREGGVPANVPPSASGWRMELTPGERNVVTATPLYVSNIAWLSTFMPDALADPCEASNRGALMAVKGDAGSSTGQVEGAGTTPNTVGRFTATPPQPGSIVQLATQLGGGQTMAPGQDFAVRAQYWRRESWREIFNAENAQ